MWWEKGDTSVTLIPADMKIMTRCGMSLGDIVSNHCACSGIPPLGSVLAYAMLRGGGTEGDVWAWYRKLRDMQENISQYYYHCQIPKTNGDSRVLCVPLGRLEMEQRFILTTILSELPVSPFAYAYRKGIRMQACAAPHVGQPLLIHLDIQDFFGSVTEKMVINRLMEETGYTKSLSRFLARLCCLKGRLPQGAPTSPILSNIVFRPCDDALARLAERSGLRYTRYSDDLYFSGSADTDVKAFLQQASELLQQAGFRLNEKKTRISRPQHRQAVLGMTVNHHLQVSRDYRRQLEKELYYLEKYADRCNGAKEAGDYVKYLRQLHGRVSYVLQADPGNARMREAHRKLTQEIKRYIFLKDRGFLC